MLEFPPLEIDITTPGPVVLECGSTATISSTRFGSDGLCAYQWSDQNGDNLWESWFDPSQLDLSTWVGADEVFITLTDGCGFSMASIEVSTTSRPLKSRWRKALTCCATSFTVTATDGTGRSSTLVQWQQLVGL